MYQPPYGAPPHGMPQAHDLRMMLSTPLPPRQRIAPTPTYASTQNGAEKEIPASAEFWRIFNLPKRTRTEEDQRILSGEMTHALRTPWGAQHLKPIQALALAELFEVGGLFGPISVGNGKTLVTYLAPEVMRATRPMLLIPASLKDKTQEEFRALSQNWRGPSPSQYRIESVQSFGRTEKATELEIHQPDLIAIDEAHLVKNEDAAVTRRIDRYVTTRRALGLPLVVICLSGTFSNRSILEYAHIVRWCLPNMCPLPLGEAELKLWADALDERINPWTRVKCGALINLCTPDQRQRVLYGDETGLKAIREAYQDRLTSTPGIVATKGGKLDLPLVVQPIYEANESPIVEAAFARLRTEWETPDGWPVSDPMAIWRHARELAMGFYYRWNPRPPDHWLQARKLWAKCVRHILRTNKRSLDSELQVVNAVIAGLYKEKTFERPMTPEEKIQANRRPDDMSKDLVMLCSANELRDRWRAVEDQFTPNSHAVWLSYDALDTAMQWALQHRGLIWVEHQAVGEELERRTGIPYYRQKGKDRRGKRIEHHPRGMPAIASVSSNGTGRNLQEIFSKNLILSAYPNGKTLEQLIGRTHRQGQLDPVVQVWFYVGCYESIAGFWQAFSDASFGSDTMGQDQRLVYAYNSMPKTEEVKKTGMRWTKPDP